MQILEAQPFSFDSGSLLQSLKTTMSLESEWKKVSQEGRFHVFSNREYLVLFPCLFSAEYVHYSAVPSAESVNLQE